MRSAEPGGRVLLGWEFAGVILAAGPAAQRFKVGDRVFGTGDMSRMVAGLSEWLSTIGS